MRGKKSITKNYIVILTIQKHKIKISDYMFFLRYANGPGFTST